ncbi:hypothetical protein Droror1_Dr00000860 [Drosera rotundifolia]
MPTWGWHRVQGSLSSRGSLAGVEFVKGGVAVKHLRGGGLAAVAAVIISPLQSHLAAVVFSPPQSNLAIVVCSCGNWSKAIRVLDWLTSPPRAPSKARSCPWLRSWWLSNR